jgi:pimeloyl-ACP methyl ester carboxylesterase
LSQHYRNIEMPVVIVTGSADRLLDPNEHAYPLQKTITNSKLIVLPDTGHQLPQTKPDDVISAIHAALASASEEMSTAAATR